MKKSILYQIQGVLVTSGRSDLAEELIIAKPLNMNKEYAHKRALKHLKEQYRKAKNSERKKILKEKIEKARERVKKAVMKDKEAIKKYKKKNYIDPKTVKPDPSWYT